MSHPLEVLGTGLVIEADASSCSSQGTKMCDPRLGRSLMKLAFSLGRYGSLRHLHPRSYGAVHSGIASQRLTYAEHTATPPGSGDTNTGDVHDAIVSVVQSILNP